MKMLCAACRQRGRRVGANRPNERCPKQTCCWVCNRWWRRATPYPSTKMTVSWSHMTLLMTQCGYNNITGCDRTRCVVILFGPVHLLWASSQRLVVFVCLRLQSLTGAVLLMYISLCKGVKTCLKCWPFHVLLMYIYISLCKGAKTCLKCWPFQMPFEQDLSECFCCSDVDDCQGCYCHGHWVVENKWLSWSLDGWKQMIVMVIGWLKTKWMIVMAIGWLKTWLSWSLGG